MTTKSDLVKTIEVLLKKFSPRSEKNKTLAYQALQGIVAAPSKPDLKKILNGHSTKKDKINLPSFEQWKKIYTVGKTAAEIADEMLTAPKEKVSGHDYGIGKGGRRGISKKWNTYAHAEFILSDTKKLLKHLGIEMKPSRFLASIGFFLRDDQEVISGYDLNTRKALSYCAAVLTGVWSRFIKEYNPKKANHCAAVKLFFGRDHMLVQGVTGRGNRPSSRSILSAVRKIQSHVTGKKHIKNTYDYKEARFYYLADLASRCNDFLGMDALAFPKRIEARVELEGILRPFTAAERLKLTRQALESLDLEDSGESDRLLDSLFNKKKPA